MKQHQEKPGALMNSEAPVDSLDLPTDQKKRAHPVLLYELGKTG